MSAFWIAAIGIIGTLAAAVLTQWLQNRAGERQSDDAERRRVADLQREAMAAFAVTLMSYRRAQLHNWHAAREQGVDPDRTSVASEVRELRALTWGALYRVQLLWRDATVVQSARELTEAVTDLKRLDDDNAIGPTADGIREQLSKLIDRGRESLFEQRA